MELKDLLFSIMMALAFVLIYYSYTLTTENYSLLSQNKDLNSQVTIFQDYLFVNRIPMYIQGVGGRFYPNKDILYVKTNYGNQQTCLFFIHELGHTIQYENKDPCYQDSNMFACEQGAINYAKENTWRCNNLN